VLVKHIVSHFDISIDQACVTLSLSKSSLYYEKKPKDDSAVVDALNALVERYPRNGFWLLLDRLRRQGFTWNHKRVYRVYKTMGLNIPRRTKRRVPERVKQPLQDLYAPNVQWSMDFMSDTLYSGRRYRVLNILDEFNRELIEFEVGTSLPSSKVIETLQRAVDFRGKPKAIRVDNGPEFISHKLEQWCHVHTIGLKSNRPGKPTQNSRVERFNGSMRREFFDVYLFDILAEVKMMAKEWIDDYNHHRPHTVLRKLSPIEYLDQYNRDKDHSI
jgi:putative transposase